MKQNTGSKLLGVLLALALVLGLVPGMSMTAYAAGATWNSSFTSEGGTISGGVDVTDDVTLTINSGVTLTVNGGINTNGHTLTVAGEGELVVNGTNGGTGGTASPTGGTGGTGGTGVTGNVTVTGGTVTITGGTGGNGGMGEHNGGTGGIGGNGVTGNVTVTGGTATITGGNGGVGGTSMRGNGAAGSPGRAVEGTITGDATESTDNSTWSTITNGTSELRYVKIQPPPHTHSLTYSASGATITATCGADNCPLTSNPTLTLTAPTLTTYGETGKSEAATLDGRDAFNTATSVNVAATDIKYCKATKSGDNYTKGDSVASAPTDAGDYLAEITLSGVKTTEGEGKSVTASLGYTIAKAAAPTSVTFTEEQKPTAKTGNDVVYNGNAIELVTAPTVEIAAEDEMTLTLDEELDGEILLDEIDVLPEEISEDGIVLTLAE